MRYVIKVKDKNGAAVPESGKFVRVYEPTAFGGRGLLEFADTPEAAHQFETEDDAIAYSMLENQKGETPLYVFTIDVVPA